MSAVAWVVVGVATALVLGGCPVGVATQSRWLTRALVPAEKSERLANYVTSLRARSSRYGECAACRTPALLGPDPLEVIDARSNGTGVRELFAYETTGERSRSVSSRAC